MKKEAKEKLQAQIKSFREEAQKKEGQAVYQMAMRIVLTEGLAFYATELADLSDEIATNFMKEDTSIELCGNYIMQIAKKANRTYGDMTVDYMKALVLEYYALDHEAIKKAEEASKAAQEALKKKRLESAKTKQVVKSNPSPIDNTPKKEQLSLFGGELIG